LQSRQLVNCAFRQSKLSSLAGSSLPQPRLARLRKSKFNSFVELCWSDGVVDINCRIVSRIASLHTVVCHVPAGWKHGSLLTPDSGTFDPSPELWLSPLAANHKCLIRCFPPLAKLPTALTAPIVCKVQPRNNQSNHTAPRGTHDLIRRCIRPQLQFLHHLLFTFLLSSSVPPLGESVPRLVNIFRLPRYPFAP